MGDRFRAGLVADSHPLYRLGLASMIVKCFGGIAIHETASFADALTTVSRNPNIKIAAIDLGLPDLLVWGGLGALAERSSQLRIVAIAPVADCKTVVDAMRAGAASVVAKDVTSTEMEDAFRRVATGEAYVPLAMQESPIEILPGKLAKNNNPLTTRQYEVLKLLAAGRSNKQIASDLTISEGTVKVHIAAAFRILGVHNRVNAAAALHREMQHVFA